MTATSWPGPTGQRDQRRGLNVGRAYWHNVGDEHRPGWIDDALRTRTPKRDRWMWAARFAAGAMPQGAARPGQSAGCASRQSRTRPDNSRSHRRSSGAAWSVRTRSDIAGEAPAHAATHAETRSRGSSTGDETEFTYGLIRCGSVGVLRRGVAMLWFGNLWPSPKWEQDMPTQTPQSARARTRGC